jgi:hypothetical protein
MEKKQDSVLYDVGNEKITPTAALSDDYETGAASQAQLRRKLDVSS